MTSNLVVAGSSPAGGASAGGEVPAVRIAWQCVAERQRDRENRKGRSMSHERTLIFFTMFMIAMVGVTAGVVTWIG